jgi:hypothetical protein
MKKHLLTFLFFQCFIAFSMAQTRYISNSGVDIGNDCTLPGNPCATISFAVSQANENDTIFVGSGSYAFTNPQIIDKSVKIIGQDTANKPVLTVSGPTIIEVMADSVTISNLRLEMGLTMADGIAGIVADGFCNGLVINQNEIISTKPITVGMVFDSYGILAFGGAAGQHITISNNVIQPADTAKDAHGRAIGIGQNGNIGPGATIYGNTLSAFYPIQSIGNSSNLNCDDNWFTGIVLITYPESGSTCTFTSNTFDAFNDQIANNLSSLLELRAFNNSNAALVQNNLFIHYKNIGLFSSASRNITVLENEFSPSDSASEFISIYANTKLFTAGTQNTNYSNQIDIRGNIFNAGLDSMGAAIVFGDHYGVTSPAFEDTITVGGPDAADKNVFDTDFKYYIVLDTLSGPSNSVSFWNGYSVSNMLPFSQSVYALAAYNEYGITDTSALEEKMLDSLEIAGLGKVILFDSLVVTSYKNFKVTAINTYPNPSLDFISVNNNNFWGLTQISILDMAGHLVYSTEQNVAHNKISIPVSQLSKGSYIMVIQNKQTLYQSKFIKE